MKITGVASYHQSFSSSSSLARSSSTATTSSSGSGDKQESQAVEQEVQRLKAIEAKVKAHESAHKSAGGGLTGAVSYEYTTGPDGKRYITGGEVSITIPSGDTPEETIRNMEKVIRAALAPVDPSPQDRAVASQAATMERIARQQESAEKKQEMEENQQKREAQQNEKAGVATSSQVSAYQQQPDTEVPSISLFA